MFEPISLLPSICVFSFATWTSWVVVCITTQPRAKSESQHPFEQKRRNRLRSSKQLYRWFEPVIEELETLVKRRNTASLSEIARAIKTSDEPLPWQATDFLAVKYVEAGLVAVFTFLIVTLLLPIPMSLLAAIISMVGYGILGEHSVRQKSLKRILIIKKRLPYAVDLIALMMHAGGGFAESVATFVGENKGHPLAAELRSVLEQIELGRSQHESLEEFSKRLRDPDVSELVFAINKGQELGTPISTILREQADQMRLKRSQWGEKAAAEAGVKVIFPGMFIVVACLIVVLAPFALPILDLIK